MNSIGIHTAETRSLDPVLTKKTTVEQKEAVKKVVTPAETNLQIKAKNVDESTFVFPFSLIPDSGLSQKEIASLAAKMSGTDTDKGNVDRSFDNFPNSFIAILLQAMETFMSSMTNINQIMQDSFKQTIAALGAARQMTDTSLEMADVTYKHSNKAAGLHLAASFGTLVTGLAGVAQIATSIRAPLNRTQDLNNAGEKFGLKPETQDVVKRLNENKANVEKWGNDVADGLGKDLAAQINAAKDQGQQRAVEHKDFLVKAEQSVQANPNSAGKKFIETLEGTKPNGIERTLLRRRPTQGTAEEFKVDHSADIDTVRGLERDSIKGVTVKADLTDEHLKQVSKIDLSNTGVIQDGVVRNTIGKTTETDANGVTTTKYVELVPAKSPTSGEILADKIEIRVLETQTDRQGALLSQKQIVVEDVKISGNPAGEFSKLDKVSKHENLSTLAEIHDLRKNWGTNRKGIEGHVLELEAERDLKVAQLEAPEGIKRSQLEMELEQKALQKAQKEHTDAIERCQQLEARKPQLAAQSKQAGQDVLKARSEFDAAHLNFQRDNSPANQQALEAARVKVEQKTGDFRKASDEEKACNGEIVTSKNKLDRLKSKISRYEKEIAQHQAFADVQNANVNLKQAELAFCKANKAKLIAEEQVKTAKTPGDKIKFKADAGLARQDFEIVAIQRQHAEQEHLKAQHKLIREYPAEQQPFTAQRAVVQAKIDKVKEDYGSRIEEAKAREAGLGTGTSVNDLNSRLKEETKTAFKKALEDEAKAIEAHERIKPTQELYTPAGMMGGATTEFQKMGQHVGRHEAKFNRILNSVTAISQTLAPMSNQIYANGMTMWQQQADADANLERGRADALRGQNDAMLKTMEQLASTWLDTSNRLLSAVLDAITNALQAAIRSVETR